MPNKKEYSLTLEGPGISVNKKVTEFQAKQVILIGLGSGPSESMTGTGGTAHPDTLIASASISGAITSRNFMASKQPSTDLERITCLAYYLYKYRSMEAFRTKDLTDLNREAAQPRFSNASFVARNAVTSRYLAIAGGGKKCISSLGEEIVEALPDRDRINHLRAAARKTRRKPIGDKRRKA